MFELSSRIRYSEIGRDGKATLNTIINYFQDCSTFDSEELEIGVEYSRQRNMGWVLASWQIVVEEYPKLGEEIIVHTWPYAFDKFSGDRNFTMKNKEGKMLAYANSLWTFFDFEKGRLAKPGEELMSRYHQEPRLDMNYEPRKIALPKELEERGHFPVRKYHLDTNQHVNNGHYIQMAQEYLKEGGNITQMRAEYKKAAVYGDEIYVQTGMLDNKQVIILSDITKKPYVIVEFSLDFQ